MEGCDIPINGKKENNVAQLRKQINILCLINFIFFGLLFFWLLIISVGLDTTSRSNELWIKLQAQHLTELKELKDNIMPSALKGRK